MLSHNDYDKSFIKPAIQKVNFDGFITAYVVIHAADNEGKIGVYIPSLMPQVGIYEKYKDSPPFPLVDSCIGNDPNEPAQKIEFSKTLNTRNFYWARPMEWYRPSIHFNDDVWASGEPPVHGHPYTDEPPNSHKAQSRKIADGQNANANVPTGFSRPGAHEEILVCFLDNDPQKCYYLPFTPTLTP